jgi:hypothetical protein
MGKRMISFQCWTFIHYPLTVRPYSSHANYTVITSVWSDIYNSQGWCFEPASSMYVSMNTQNDDIQVRVLNIPLMTGSSWCILSTNQTRSTLVKRHTYGTCINKGAGTSSLLVTASGSSMMNWEVAAAKLKWHMTLSSVDFKKQTTAAVFLKVTYHIQQPQFVPYIYHHNITLLCSLLYIRT